MRRELSDAQINGLIARADVELVQHKGSQAESLLRKAYAAVYDRLTPILHEKVIEILAKLSDALQIQGLAIERNELKRFIRDLMKQEHN